jgi:nitrate reductase assembly molybdenum cofactor insertion protein NarJ
MAGSLIAFLLSIIFFATYKKADAAETGLGEVRKDVAVLQECIKTVNKNYDVINYKLDKLLGWEK